MATITKRNNTYKITVSSGSDINGKQIRHFMTWKPPEGMTAKQAEKEVKRQAVLFEERIRTGTYLDGSIKFTDFAEQWLNEYAKKQLRATTVERYNSMLVRINQAIGHMRLDRIQPQHLLSFYNNLSDQSVRADKKYKSCCDDLHALMKENKITYAGLAKAYNISETTISNAVKKKNVSEKTAKAISKALNKPLEALFIPTDEGKALSNKTIHHYHELISSILSTAVQWNIILLNPCDRVKPPKTEKPKPKYIDEVQARELIELLQDEDTQFKVMIDMLLFTGLRRGELLGLEWSDIDFDNNTIHICRSSLYLASKGTFEDKTKTESSERTLKVAPSVISLLKEQKVYQAKQRLKVGDLWEASDRIFTGWNGKPLNPTFLDCKFRRFKEKHGIKDLSLHGLRHTYATLQIAAGTPITTVAKELGHASPSTTLNTYSHAVKSADEKAAETIENILSPKKA
ncbi:MAG: tyrosine-type recombinase/integrase [Acutalibacteraceae bacterium]